MEPPVALLDDNTTHIPHEDLYRKVREYQINAGWNDKMSIIDMFNASQDTLKINNNGIVIHCGNQYCTCGHILPSDIVYYDRNNRYMCKWLHPLFAGSHEQKLQYCLLRIHANIQLLDFGEKLNVMIKYRLRPSLKYFEKIIAGIQLFKSPLNLYDDTMSWSEIKKIESYIKNKDKLVVELRNTTDVVKRKKITGCIRTVDMYTIGEIIYTPPWILSFVHDVIQLNPEFIVNCPAELINRATDFMHGFYQKISDGTYKNNVPSFDNIHLAILSRYWATGDEKFIDLAFERC
jgi:hypothetical protein